MRLKPLVIAAIILLLPSMAGAVKYVKVTSSGAADGSDWDNAYGGLPATLDRSQGTYYLAEGSYGAYTFNTAGTTPITIAVCGDGDGTCENATGYVSTDHDAPAIFGIINHYTGYITWTGRERDETNPPFSWKTTSAYNLKIDATAGQRTFRTSSGYTPPDVELAYAWLEGYGSSIDGNRVVYAYYGGADWHIHHNYFEEAGDVFIHWGAGNNNSIVEYNWFYQNYSSGEAHGEMFQTSTSAGPDDVLVRYNIFQNGQGTGVIVLNNADDWQIYGNWFIDYHAGADGVICVTGGKGYSSYWTLIYNNTFASGDCYFANTGDDYSWDIKNNLFFDCSRGLSFSSASHTYNGTDEATMSEGGTEQTSMATSIFTNYGTFDLTLSGATDAGTSLAADDYQDYDRLVSPAVQRGADSNWDRGGSEYGTAVRTNYGRSGGGGSGNVR